MNVKVERAPMYVSAAKVFLTVANPVQKIVQKPSQTHLMCNRQARMILFNDGFAEFAEIVDEFAFFMDKGVLWADEGFKNMSHFFNPRTCKGLNGWTDAARECNLFWSKAAKMWKTGDFEKAFFYTGAALHLVQDLCAPHHALGVLFEGHQEYEHWAEEHKENYRVLEEGIYNLGDTPADWIRANAISAARHFHLVRSSCENNYHKATSVLLPRAQKVTAGFLHFFLNKMMG